MRFNAVLGGVFTHGLGRGIKLEKCPRCQREFTDEIAVMEKESIRSFGECSLCDKGRGDAMMDTVSRSAELVDDAIEYLDM